VLAYLNFQPSGGHVTVTDIQNVVLSNDKQRFALNELEGEDGQTQLWIRANQGHSMDNIQPELKPILKVEDIPSGIAVHGTYHKPWKIIQRDGLNRMGRNHIHFAIGEIDHSQVISGMRSNAQVLIYLDVQKALDDGIPLFLSQNNVVLSPGINGVIAPKYFKEVKKY
jgi:2'-phosphotransferase